MAVSAAEKFSAVPEWRTGRACIPAQPAARAQAMARMGSDESGCLGALDRRWGRGSQPSVWYRLSWRVVRSQKAVSCRTNSANSAGVPGGTAAMPSARMRAWNSGA